MLYCLLWPLEAVARGLDDVSNNRLKCAYVSGIRLPFDKKFTYPVSYYFLLATDYIYVVTYVYLYKLLRWCEESWFTVRHGCSFDFQERLVESEGRPNQDANCKPVSLFYTIGYQCRSSSPLGRVGYCRSGQLCICFCHGLAAVVERGLGRGNFRRSRCLAVIMTETCVVFVLCFVRNRHLL